MVTGDAGGSSPYNEESTTNALLKSDISSKSDFFNPPLEEYTTSNNNSITERSSHGHSMKSNKRKKKINEFKDKFVYKEVPGTGEQAPCNYLLKIEEKRMSVSEEADGTSLQAESNMNSMIGQ